MQFRLPLTILLALNIFSQSPVAHAADPCDGKSRPGHYLVRVNQTRLKQLVGAQFTSAERTHALLDVLDASRVIRNFHSLPGMLYIEAPSLNLANAEKMYQQGVVEYIEPDKCWSIGSPERQTAPGTLGSEPVRAAATPNDPRYAELWGLNSSNSADADVDAAGAWDLTTGSSSVVVAVIDTGVDYNHQDLQANMWTNSGEIPNNNIDDDSNGIIDDYYGRDCVSFDSQPDGNPLDLNGHGTHVAGTISAVGNNSIGVVGVNWNAKIMALRFLDAEGSGFTSDAITCIDYMVARKNDDGVNVRVANNSWGGGGASSALDDAIGRANSAGILFAAAAGNDGTDNDLNPHYPSSSTVANVLAVASNTENGVLSSFSNYGAVSVDVSAPGSGILSTTPSNTYSVYSGTSMATPHVSGVAALIAAREPALSVAQLKSRIMDTVKPVSGFGGKLVSPGIVSALRALGAASGAECTVSSGSIPRRSGSDSDGDGVSDAQEATDGTDANNADSFIPRFASPMFGLWTGFLGITNIFEAINNDDEPMNISIRLYSISGQLLSTTAKSIGARSQSDTIINDLSGFQSNSYGYFVVDWCNGESAGDDDGKLIGGVTMYRARGTTSSLSQDYDFVASIALTSPYYGKRSVASNTYPPAIDIVGADNWVTLQNLGTSSNSFTATSYSMLGEQLLRKTYSVNAKSRTDFQGGHENPGPDNVGSIEIDPSDDDAPWFGVMQRYMRRSDNSYAAAFPLPARAGSDQPMYVKLTTTLNSQNWLEVYNLGSASASVQIDFRTSSGSTTALDVLNVTLPAHSQRHYNVNERLGSNATGYAKITPSTGNLVAANSMIYINDSSGYLLGMYGSPAISATKGTKASSTNFYLEQSNWLYLINPNSSTMNGTITLYTPNSGTNAVSFSIPSGAARDFGLHESAYGTSANTFGPVSVSVSSPSGASFVGELLRLRTDPVTGLTDFIHPTPIR